MPSWRIKGIITGTVMVIAATGSIKQPIIKRNKLIRASTAQRFIVKELTVRRIIWGNWAETTM